MKPRPSPIPRRRFEGKTLTFTPTSNPTYDVGGRGWTTVLSLDQARAQKARPLCENSLVSIARQFIRGNVPKGRLVAGTVAGGEYRESAGHPLTAMLARPNPWESWTETLAGAADDLAVYGNGYWAKARNFGGMGDVREVYWAPFIQVEVVPETDPRRMVETGPVRCYIWDTGISRRTYLPSDFVHFRNGRDPWRRYMGMSNLDPQRGNAGAVEAGERYTGNVLRNAHAGKILASKENVTDGSAEESTLNTVAGAVERGMSGDNLGRITKSTLPVDLIDGGMGPQSMMLDTIVDRPEGYVLAALGLNTMALNLPASSGTATFNNKGEAAREAMRHGILPLQDLIADGITRQLLPDFPDPAEVDAVWWNRADVEDLREDADGRAARAVSMRNAPVPLCSFNEARALCDLKPVDGGDRNPLDEAAEAAALQAETNAAMQAHADAGGDVGGAPPEPPAQPQEGVDG